MEKTAKEMMHNYVKSQKFSSTGEIMEAMKDMFRDALEQVMECELEEHLGYEKSERVSESGENAVSKNYRNGYSNYSYFIIFMHNTIFRRFIFPHPNELQTIGSIK